MKKGLFVFLIAFAVSGCAFKILDEGLPRLVGQPIDSAINVLGLPNSKMEIAGRTVYIWNSQRSGTIPIYNTNTAYTTGTVGTTPVYGTTTSSTINYVPVNYQCEIKLSVSSQNIITLWEYYGNQGGCQRYANGLKALTQ